MQFIKKSNPEAAENKEPALQFTEQEQDSTMETFMNELQKAETPDKAATFAGLIVEYFPTKADFPLLERYVLATQNVDTITNFAIKAYPYYDTSKLGEFVLTNASFLKRILFFTRVDRCDKDAFLKAILWDESMIGAAKQGSRNHYYDLILKVKGINCDIMNQWLIQFAADFYDIGAYTAKHKWVNHQAIFQTLLKAFEDDHGYARWNTLQRYFIVNAVSSQLPIDPMVDAALNADVDRGLLTLLEDCQEYGIPLPAIPPLQQKLIGTVSFDELIIITRMNGADIKLTQSALEKEGDIYYLEKIWNMSGFDHGAFQNYIIQRKEVSLCISYIRNSEYPSKNIPLLQQFVEKHGDVRDMNEFLNTRVKFNFKSFKKRYNDLKEKELANPNAATPTDHAAFIQHKFKKYVDEVADPAAKADMTEFLNDIIAKKDWFSIRPDTLQTLTKNTWILLYKHGAKKSYLQIHNEVFRQNYEALLRLKTCQALVHGPEFVKLLGDGFIIKLAETSNNFDQFIKLAEKTCKGMGLAHNTGVDMELIKLAIVNPKFSLEDKTNEELLETFKLTTNVLELRSKVRALNATRAGLINEDEFNANLSMVGDLQDKFERGEAISFQRGTPQYNAVKKLHVDLSMINDFHSIKLYLEVAKPKNEKLKSFNLDIDGFNFKVLNFLDPYAFKVGAETDCCQRIGGVGENAAIDSFINPEASVLALNYQGKLVAQSYFHYVPAENGLILDNVEANSNYLSHLGLDTMSLSKLYADYAAIIKANNPEIAYVRCGKAYNKIGNDLFEQGKMAEDPRHFEIEELDDEEAYSDFEEDDHIDLLAPNAGLKNVKVEVTKRAFLISNFVKTARLTATVLRTLLLRRYGL